MDVDLSQDGSSSPADNQLDSETDHSSSATSSSERQQVANAIAELDKMEKFRFEGQEYTPKALKDAILRMKDYTQKTQEHSKSVESFKQEKKFYENLWDDIENVRRDRSLATEFLKLYPEQFHSILKRALSGESNQASSQQTQTSPMIDVDTQAKIVKLEKFVHEQEVAKNTNEINSLIEKYSKQFPKSIPKLAIAEVFEAFNQGSQPTPETWEQAFKASQEYRESLLKQDYGELVKKQTQANQKARDVDAGGGTPGRAPKKFGSLREVTEHAANEVSHRRG